MEETHTVLTDYGLDDLWRYHETAFSRNLGLIDANELELLARTTVSIAGLGGVGGSHLITLARCGVGRFNLAEFDHYEAANVNRQCGAQVLGFGRPKLDVMIEQANAVNPHLEIKTFPEGIHSENIDAFLAGADVVLDGVDFFAIEARRLLFNRALELGIPVITAGPLGFSSALLVFMPGGMGFDEYFSINPEIPDKKKILHFAVGLTPRPTHARYIDMGFVDLESERGPSLAPAIQLCASLAVTEVLRIVLSRGKVKPAPYYVLFDPYLRKFRTGYLRRGNASWVQRLKIYAVERALSRLKRIGAEKPTMPNSTGAVNNDVMRYIVRAGIQAPSGDNVQPWRFSFDGNTVNIFLNRSADSCFFNVRQVASTIASGAAIRNMVAAGKAMALNPVVELLPDGKQPDLMAQLKFTSMKFPQDEILNDALWKRCTNRKMYSRRPVSDGVWQRMESLLTSYPGVRLQWASEREQLSALANVVARVDIIRTENKDLHIHLMNMTRFSASTATASGDGLPLKNLEAGILGEAFLRSTRPWPVMAAANALGVGKLISRHSAQAVIASGGAGVISVEGDGVKDFLKAGQALQEVWLQCAHLGIQLQPMAAAPLFRLRWVWEGAEAFAPAHRSLLEACWPELDELFPDFTSRYPVMMFRVGFAKSIRYGTYRRPLDGFLQE